MTRQPIKPRLLITGPFGRVGRELVPRLRADYRLRLFDSISPQSLELVEEDEFVQGDIRVLYLPTIHVGRLLHCQ